MAELEGIRVNVYLPAKHRKIARDIDNLSGFLQMALEQAAGIMAFDIIKREKGYSQPLPTQEQYNEFNQNHPLDPLTKKRENKKCETSSQPKPELW